MILHYILHPMDLRAATREDILHSRNSLVRSDAQRDQLRFRMSRGGGLGRLHSGQAFDAQIRSSKRRAAHGCLALQQTLRLLCVGQLPKSMGAIWKLTVVHMAQMSPSVPGRHRETYLAHVHRLDSAGLQYFFPIPMRRHILARNLASSHLKHASIVIDT